MIGKTTLVRGGRGIESLRSVLEPFEGLEDASRMRVDESGRTAAEKLLRRLLKGLDGMEVREGVETPMRDGLMRQRGFPDILKVYDLGNMSVNNGTSSKEGILIYCKKHVRVRGI